MSNIFLKYDFCDFNLVKRLIKKKKSKFKLSIFGECKFVLVGYLMTSVKDSNSSNSKCWKYYLFAEFVYIISNLYRNIRNNVFKGHSERESKRLLLKNIKHFPTDIAKMIYKYCKLRNYKLFELYNNPPISITNKSLNGLMFYKSQSLDYVSAICKSEFLVGESLHIFFNNNKHFMLGIISGGFFESIPKICTLYDLTNLRYIFAFEALYDKPRFIYKLPNNDPMVKNIDCLSDGDKIAMKFNQTQSDMKCNTDKSDKECNKKFIDFIKNDEFIISFKSVSESIHFRAFITFGKENGYLEVFSNNFL